MSNKNRKKIGLIVFRKTNLPLWACSTYENALDFIKRKKYRELGVSFEQKELAAIEISFFENSWIPASHENDNKEKNKKRSVMLKNVMEM